MNYVAEGSAAQDSLLHSHRVLLRVGLALANVFAWIFVFEYFFALSGDAARAFAGVLLAYGLSQGITIFVTPISAAHLRSGTKRALILAPVVAAFAYVILGATLAGMFTDHSYVWGIVLFSILLGTYRALYWVPYKISRAGVPHGIHRLHGLFEILVALMPLFASLTILSLPFAPLRILFGAAALLCVSALPVLFLKDSHEKYSWSYFYTFSQVLRRKHTPLVLRSFFEGVQGATLFLIWPLAVFFIVDRSYEVLGIVFSLTLLLILVLRGLFGSIFKALGVENSPIVHTTLVISGWVTRLAAGTPLGIIIADSYSYATLPSRGTMSDPFIQQQSSDKGSFIDEYTVLKEIARASGKITLCIVAGMLAYVAPLPIAFAGALLLAAFSSGMAVALAAHPTAKTF